MNKTAIEWCDFTWNPVVGCTKGCEFCYARRQAKRFKQRCQLCYEFVPHLHAERLGEPAKRKKPSRIFVCSMGELFDPELATTVCGDAVFRQQYPWDLTRAVLDVPRLCPQHTFLVLTKRPEIALEYLGYDVPRFPALSLSTNVHLGVSVTNQADADERIPLLLQCNAAVRGVSYEPALGPVDFGHIPFGGSYRGDVLGGRVSFERPTLDVERRMAQCQTIDWLVIGAETGNRKGKIVPKREWIQSAIDQCRAAGVPVFVKDNIVKLYPAYAGIRELPK